MSAPERSNADEFACVWRDNVIRTAIGEEREKSGDGSEEPRRAVAFR